MEQKIKEVTEKLTKETITKDEADKILLGLLNVINRRRLLIDFVRWYNELDGFRQGYYTKAESRADAFLKSINSL
jgi:hypothetical protein